MRWEMPTRSRKKIWNGLCNVRGLKLWFLPSQNRSFPRRDSSSGVLAAVKSRDESLEALAQGEQRLSELKLQETPFTVPVTDTGPPPSASGRVARFDYWRTGQDEVPVETMPGLVPAELSTWMEDRQRDVQEPLSKGDHIRVAELSVMITKGAERMVEMTRQEISDEEFQSRAAPGEGWFAPY